MADDTETLPVSESKIIDAVAKLRDWGNEYRKRGRFGAGNTFDGAANVIEALAAANVRLERDLDEIRSTAAGITLALTKQCDAAVSARINAEAERDAARAALANAEVERERLAKALKALESACDARTAATPGPAYDVMVAHGMAPVLLALDEARRSARAALTPAPEAPSDER